MDAVTYCDRHYQPLARVVKAALLANGDLESKETVLRRVLRSEIRDLEIRVPALATIGSVTPFIGLFGTVIGIMRAFADISSHAGGGPEVVAGGIAEALVTTAAGLVVAIPAIIAYNYFRVSIRRLSEEIELAAQEIIHVHANLS